MRSNLLRALRPHVLPISLLIRLDRVSKLGAISLRELLPAATLEDVCLLEAYQGHWLTYGDVGRPFSRAVSICTTFFLFVNLTVFSEFFSLAN